ncbi:uncharacterized protein LOC124474908 [Hypomesus transpacificus]|uniref:uncharacterized protein LOC124474908 n=1 Tax=Hypomesus transpacificus TaxID=137520 RepID=UPI001F074D9C|nr:uncharacterized protein LOC124474908 [Hypomesus transpacificus]
MPPVPSPVWLLTVYSMDVLSRLDEVEARVTSVFGSILKMDSTKKVTKKLAGAAANTAAWVTNVDNKHGQVLMSVLTSAESVDLLLPMAVGLQERYRLAGVPPPQLMYVDRDCCSSFGGSKTAALFANWDRLVVRLDIWHLMRRFAAGVTTESHQLYGPFGGEKGHDTLGIPLLDGSRIQAIWREQRRHLHCIQDPPAVQLYTETGRLTKGSVSLPVYRCARGSTSLESFHLHNNRFIPGTSANAHHFQALLLDGLVRWNENCAAAAVEGREQPLLSYSGHLQHSLNQLSQRVLGVSLVKDHTAPREYTGV